MLQFWKWSNKSVLQNLNLNLVEFLNYSWYYFYTRNWKIVHFLKQKYMSYPGNLSCFFLIHGIPLPVSHRPVNWLHLPNGWQMKGSFEEEIREISFLCYSFFSFFFFTFPSIYFNHELILHGYWQAKLIDLSSKTKCAHRLLILLLFFFLYWEYYFVH